VALQAVSARSDPRSLGRVGRIIQEPRPQRVTIQFETGGAGGGVAGGVSNIVGVFDALPLTESFHDSERQFGEYK